MNREVRYCGLCAHDTTHEVNFRQYPRFIFYDCLGCETSHVEEVAYRYDPYLLRRKDIPRKEKRRMRAPTLPPWFNLILAGGGLVDLVVTDGIPTSTAIVRIIVMAFLVYAYFLTRRKPQT